MSADLRVIAPPRLAPGFRLAGALVDEADDAAAAEQLVRALIASPAKGVVGIHEPFFAQLPASLRKNLDPLLVAIPEGVHGEGVASRRARLTAMLQQAIGYHFVFGERAP